MVVLVVRLITALLASFVRFTVAHFRIMVVFKLVASGVCKVVHLWVFVCGVLPPQPVLLLHHTITITHSPTHSSFYPTGRQSPGPQQRPSV